MILAKGYFLIPEECWFQYMTIVGIFICSASITLWSDTAHDIFIGSKGVASSYFNYSATKCLYLVMIHCCKGVLHVDIAAHVSMWYRKDISLLSNFLKRTFIPGRPLSTSRGMGRVCVYFVYNVLVVNVNRHWYFLEGLSVFNCHEQNLHNFCSDSIS